MLRAAQRRARPARARRAASVRPAGQSLHRPRRRRLAGQCVPLRGAVASRRASALGDVAGFVPDVVHAHDWQAGLARLPAYDGGPRPATVMTVHNLAFQGQFPRDCSTGFGCRGTRSRSTASSTTARSAISRPACSSPIASPPCRRPTRRRSGRPRAAWGSTACCAIAPTVLRGILNGIDDRRLESGNRSAHRRRGSTRRIARRARRTRQRVAAALRARPMPDALLFGVVSRLSWQKGLDLLLDAMPALLAGGAQLAVLGTGDPELEQRLRRRRARASGPRRLHHRLRRGSRRI